MVDIALSWQVLNFFVFSINLVVAIHEIASKLFLCNFQFSITTTLARKSTAPIIPEGLPTRRVECNFFFYSHTFPFFTI